MKIKSESFSDLMNKHTLITVELTRLAALMVYYSDSGNKTKCAQTIDAIKRLEMSKGAIAIELDKRIPNSNVQPQEPNDRSSDSEDKLRPSS